MFADVISILISYVQEMICFDDRRC